LALALVVRMAHGEPGKPGCAVKASPRQAFGPSDVRVTVTVDPDPANRQLDLGLVDELGPIQASSRRLEGDRSKKTWEVWFRQAPPGNWAAVAVITRADGTSCRAAAQVTLIPRD
jgi:hypothetical protein